MAHRDPSEGVSMLDLHYQTDKAHSSIASRAQVREARVGGYRGRESRAPPLPPG